MNRNSAIVVVDMLYDFIDGSLACQNADNAVKECRKFILSHKEHTWGEPPVIFIRDFHPSNHCSFAEQGGDWPVHCVEGTRGSEIHTDLQEFVEEDLTFFKGRNPQEEQYSGAEGKNLADQSLVDVLGIMDCEEVYVCGIATEFCVKNTAEDLLKAGFKVNLVKEALAWVDKNGHDKALKEMEAEGIRII